jgi:hypothetical protein
VNEPDAYPRTVLFVAGAGRSGTSTMAGIMSLLGLHVPLPEVVADASNPKGFSEPQWAVDFHDRLLAEANVTVSDSRPSAWFETGRVATREPERIKAAAWLEQHFAVADELIVKDPRLGWFLPLWRVAAIRSSATPVFATMLRPPAEVVGSKQKYYNNKLGSAHLAASWLNMLLHTERATRDSVVDGGRVFVRYADLIEDWTKVTMSVAERLELQHVLHAKSEQIRDGHRFIDPSLRRVELTLAELGLPPRLHDVVENTWEQLNLMVEPDGDTPGVRATLDELREAYVALYEESEAISKSSVVAATAEVKKRLMGRQAPTGAAASEPATGLTDRIPHDLRAKIPPGLRRGLRKALGRSR